MAVANPLRWKASNISITFARPFCLQLPIHGSANFPLSLARDHGAALGVYFDPQTSPCKMTVAEAATKVTEGFTDAIFSLVPGKKAISFHHEGGAWLCER